MTAGVRVLDGESNQAAMVTEFKQLVVAPIAYSTPVQQVMDATGTAFNFIVPVQGKSIVITDVIVSANKNVSNTTPADIVIYESGAANSLTNIETILQPQLTGASNLAITGLNLIIPKGVWVNASTDDATVLLTIMFYRVPV